MMGSARAAFAVVVLVVTAGCLKPYPPPRDDRDVASSDVRDASDVMSDMPQDVVTDILPIDRDLTLDAGVDATVPTDAMMIDATTEPAEPLCRAVPTFRCEGGDDRAVDLAVGGGHACVRLRNCTVWCWGANNEGQAGRAVVDAGRLVDATVSRDASTDDAGACAAAEPRQVTGLGDVVMVAAGGSQTTDQAFGHTCVLNLAHEVLCWGSNSYGQVTGTAGPPGSYLQTPQQVVIPLRSREEQIIGISAGIQHTCAWSNCDRVYCWGDTQNDRLGRTLSSHVPSQVQNLELVPIARVVAGGESTCAIEGDGDGGRVLCWGSNQTGQLGFGDVGTNVRVPAAVEGADRGAINTVSEIGISSHACARLHNHSVYCWGNPQHTLLGLGLDGGARARVVEPPTLNAVMGATEIAVGLNHSCAITQSGSQVVCWGNNEYSIVQDRSERCGGEGLTCIPDPYPVTPPDPIRMGVHYWSDPVAHIGVGVAFSCALTRQGRVYCWGLDDQGQLGDRSCRDIDEHPGPTLVDGPWSVLRGD